MAYSPTIGLEVHAELKTRTKMFCDSPNDSEEREPNKNVCPVCLGHPGTLPTINKEAVAAVIKVGLALGGEINAVTKFDRKNYFYPDLPKGYQISQYDKSIVVGGSLLGVRLRRIHLEEDTGRLLHETPNLKLRGGGADASYVDFNRAGVPLMELVTEPDIKSAEEAAAFAKELQLIFQYLKVSDADMEKGHLRLEANVSLSRIGADGARINADENNLRKSASDPRESASTLGTKVEIKNINSFKALGSAIAYELERQKELIEKGEKVVQETRGWDDSKQRTVSQRSKEEAHDYRYFPEPDLPPFRTSEFDLERLWSTLPELPQEKRGRFAHEYGLDIKQAESLVAEPALAEYFEEAASELAARDERTSSKLEKKPLHLLYNYLTSDFRGLANEAGICVTESKVNPEHLAHLVDLIADGKIQSRQAKDILKQIFETGADPEEMLIESEGLHTISDEIEIQALIEKRGHENPKLVDEIKSGKGEAIDALLALIVKESRGTADPEKTRAIIKRTYSSYTINSEIDAISGIGISALDVKIPVSKKESANQVPSKTDEQVGTVLELGLHETGTTTPDQI